MRRANGSWWMDDTGLNLIELMVVSVVSSIVMVGLFVVFSAGRNAYFTTDAKVTMREQERGALQALEQDVRSARLRSYCADAAGNGCAGGLAASLTLQLPRLIDANDPFSFYDPSTGTTTWETTNGVAYQWTRGAGIPPTPTPLYRCSPAAVCRVVAPRVTSLTMRPLQPDGATGYASPMQFYKADGTPNADPMPAMVDVTIEVAPAQTQTSGQVNRYTSSSRILLRNPQR